MSHSLRPRRAPALHVAMLAGAAILVAQAEIAAAASPQTTIRPVARPAATVLAADIVLPPPPIRPVARPDHAPFSNTAVVPVDVGAAFDAPSGAPFTIMPDTLVAVSFSTAEFDATQDFITFADLSSYRLQGRADETREVKDPQVIRLASELESVIIAQLESEYDMHNGEAGDVERLFDLADGIAISDWGTPASHLIAMQVTDARFEPPAPSQVVPTTSATAVDDMRKFLATPEGMAALAQMTPEQIAALAQVMESAAAPTAIAVVPPPAPAPGPSVLESGVPPLSFGDASETVDDGRILGGTTDLLLRDWRISQDNGVTSMFLVNNPGSRIDVRPGMVLGALGEITGIDVTDGSVTVTFDNGEVLTGDVSGDKISG